jgi:hypothetical protein
LQHLGDDGGFDRDAADGKAGGMAAIGAAAVATKLPA